MNVLDIAWLAGLLEGEGAFTWHQTQRNRGRPRTQLSMGDKDTVEKAAALLGANVCGPYGPYTTQKKPYYYTHCSGSKAAGWMMTVLKFMSARRQADILRLLAKWRAL